MSWIDYIVNNEQKESHLMSRTMRKMPHWMQPSDKPDSHFQFRMQRAREKGKNPERLTELTTGQNVLTEKLGWPSSSHPKCFTRWSSVPLGSRHWAKQKTAKMMRKRGRKDCRQRLDELYNDQRQENILIESIEDYYESVEQYADYYDDYEEPSVDEWYEVDYDYDYDDYVDYEEE